MTQDIYGRAKFGYLTYDDMLIKIQDNILDGYDICYTKDTNECYIIRENFTPSPIRSRVYIFQNESDAITQLNQNTDTYNGQIVSILCGDRYQGYIVNTTNGSFTVSPLNKITESIDYNTLGNRPIVNFVGTLDKPIIVSDLNDGIYNIKGQYKISDLIDTIYLSASNVIFTVRKDADKTFIKSITSNNISDFCISNGSISSHEYITDQYLKDNNYVTAEYVEVKIQALQQSIEEDVKQYVSTIVNEQMGTVLDEKIEAKINEAIEPVESTDINSLFN